MNGSHEGKPATGAGLPDRAKAIRLIVRADDMGMTHSCNTAVARCFEHGILTCAAIQAPAPWAAEAAALYRRHPAWCIGAHLTPMGEWVGYRWRPVLPHDRVSTLVDEDGFLKQTVQDFYARPIDYDQLFREFMAQVSLLQERWGLGLGYIDCHYLDGSIPRDPSYAQVVASVARHYRLPLSEQMNERKVEGVFFVPPGDKEEVLLGRLRQLGPGVWLLVNHLLDDSAESQALAYANPADFTEGGVANHRAAEAKALLGERVRQVIEEKGIRLVSYRDLASES
jgi:predicted glycoside hydrolase/deacetylase ChbG (UPF0249 family)